MRTPLRVAALTTLALALGVLPLQVTADPAAAAGNVSVNQYRAVPQNGVLTLSGRGFGHGRGMSQYGAEGAARRGLSHEEILRFYYPGTTLEQATEQLEVLVTADTTSDVIVVNRPGLQVRDHGIQTTMTLPQNFEAIQWRITTDRQNRDVLQYRSSNVWTSWKTVRTFTGTPEFRSPGSLQLVLPGSKLVSYRGFLRAARPSADATARDTINALPLDSYVKGVVAKEMPASWSPEAVQAQTVAARTYATYHQQRSGSRHYDVDDTTRYQVYGGMSGEHPLSNKAVDATSKQVLTWKGAPAFTEFSSSSGGWTVASGISYQVAKADPYDNWSGNHNRAWSVKLNRAAVQRKYPQIGTLKGIRFTQRDGNGVWGGRVLKVALEGTKGTKTLTGDQFRVAFGLKSTWVTFS